MGRVGVYVLAGALLLSGCTVVTAVGGLVGDQVITAFSGREAAYPEPAEKVLAASQKALQGLDLQISLLEPLDDGFWIEFGNRKLDGQVKLLKQTKHLTTAYAKVRSGVRRKESIEEAILGAVRHQLDAQALAFTYQAYRKVRADPSEEAPALGWYLPGSRLDVSQVEQPGWLRLKMPSGKVGYIKASIRQTAKG